MLANPAGQPDDILVVAGQVVVTGEVTSVGYRTTFIAGQLAAPAASRDALEPAIQMQGQVIWYEGANPRVFNGDVRLGADFLRLLAAPPRWSCWATSASSTGSPRPRCGRSWPALPRRRRHRAGRAHRGVQIVATDVLGDIMSSDRPSASDGPDGSGS